MELETMQLLNLSPIPELSEMELSTMLDHLSGLSDINSDLTDRNVEDILKEAEDLLEKSTSSKNLESVSISESQGAVQKNTSDIQDKNIFITKETETDLKDNEKDIVPSNNDLLEQESNSKEEFSSLHYNSPTETTPTKVYSPNSCNHIKSTIDSLKEFSNLIEKKLSKESEKSSPKQIITSKEVDRKTDLSLVNHLQEKGLKKEESNYSKKTKTSELAKENFSASLDKSVKLLNCFERLYQDKPVRLSNSKKSKFTDKLPKNTVKKKLAKDFKTIKKNTWQGKSLAKKNSEDCGSLLNEKSFTTICTSNKLKENECLRNNVNFFSNNQKSSIVQKESDLKDLPKQNKHNHCSEFNLAETNNDEKKLMMKVLEGMEELKDQVRKVGVFHEGSHKVTTLVNHNSSPEEKIGGKNIISEGAKNADIQRLEEQFSALKEKYDRQIEKLECENMKLKEQLNHHQKISPPEISINETSNKKLPVTARSYLIPYINTASPFAAEKRVTRSVSLENCKVPNNSPEKSLEKLALSPPLVKDAFSQTETELKTASIQCSLDFAEVGKFGMMIEQTKKADNKENVKKSIGKMRPISDFIATRQKKILVDHESQLLATIRGLQGEVTSKEKENRKLRTEIDSLKRQLKKQNSCKSENGKKFHAGTQTIGLGVFAQKPYSPENFEVPLELEKENEDLRLRVKALEEDFELLKEKRITDLQSLHQVHEEEMAKVVSKLETQSALTRHLHSLLVNR